MKTSILIQSMLALSLGAGFSIAMADDAAAPAASAAVTVHGATPASQIAPTWREDHNYKFGDLASYDGLAFKAKSGTSHRRPDASSQVGWEVLNACDDKSKGAVQCEISKESVASDGNVDKQYQTFRNRTGNGGNPSVSASKAGLE
jgi:chitodextrinase